MPTSKIAITIDKNILKEVDSLVKSKRFPNRSKLIQEALTEKLKKIEKEQFIKECEKLDPDFEKKLSEEGFSAGLEEWTKY